jgi:hypothetical protein
MSFSAWQLKRCPELIEVIGALSLHDVMNLLLVFIIANEIYSTFANFILSPPAAYNNNDEDSLGPKKF